MVKCNCITSFTSPHSKEKCALRCAKKCAKKWVAETAEECYDVGVDQFTTFLANNGDQIAGYLQTGDA